MRNERLSEWLITLLKQHTRINLNTVNTFNTLATFRDFFFQLILTNHSLHIVKYTGDDGLVTTPNQIKRTQIQHREDTWKQKFKSQGVWTGPNQAKQNNMNLVAKIMIYGSHALKRRNQMDSTVFPQQQLITWFTVRNVTYVIDQIKYINSLVHSNLRRYKFVCSFVAIMIELRWWVQTTRRSGTDSLSNKAIGTITDITVIVGKRKCFSVAISTRNHGMYKTSRNSLHYSKPTYKGRADRIRTENQSI